MDISVFHEKPSPNTYPNRTPGLTYDHQISLLVLIVAIPSDHWLLMGDIKIQN